MLAVSQGKKEKTE